MLAKWCETTSCHGIMNLYEARKNRPLFLFWTFLMSFMMCASLFFMYTTVQGYIDSPYSTTITTISNTTLVLPEILICSNGGFNVSALKEANFSEDFIHVFMRDSANVENNRNLSIEEASGQLVNFINQNNLTSRSIYDRFELNCDKIVLRRLRPANYYAKDNNPCDHVKTFSSLLGTCFAFVNNGYQYQQAYGVVIELASPNSSYANTFAKESSDMRIDRDFSIVIEMSLDSIIPITRSKRIPSNSRVDIVLYPKLYIRIFKKNECEVDETYPSSYSCYARCEQKLSTRACNCTVLDYSESRDTQVCLPFASCDWHDYSPEFAKCSSKCIQKCVEWKYDPMITISPIDARLADNRSFVYIFYDNLQYQKIEEVQSFTYDMAIANIGGQCGLWLGASFVTIIEVFYYLVLIVTNRAGINKKTADSKIKETDADECNVDDKQVKYLTHLMMKQRRDLDDTIQILMEKTARIANMSDIGSSKENNHTLPLILRD